MDSFFSLFDPSDGAGNNNNKKKGDAPKGRRKGRKSTGKNETLPEESSFLCEPDLSTELLVKDGSYIESYIEVNSREGKSETDKNKPKRRNSGRKTRRRKCRISPAKDPNLFGTLTDTDAETSTPITENTGVHGSETGFTKNVGNNWNNRSSKPKFINSIGKNVNDLSTEKEFKNCKRKNSKDFPNGSFQEKEVYNVIDKLEKVGLKDDMYLAGDFNTEDLENDVFYSSDESFDDSTSEGSGSADECYGSLPPEPRFGNVEYKLQLVSVCEKRFQHLVTQLKWRLRSGGGSAVYVLGVRDCGALHGLRARALRASLHTLRQMAMTLRATLTHVTARRVAPHRAVAEVYIRKLADTQQSVELRVAVMGANEAGKSTLIGVLTQGELDNGRGSARLNMFRHLHEVKSGRTSSLSHEILGFDSQGNVVNYGCSELMTAERIGERSAKLVSFLDLAGHSKYQKTTLHGLTGYCPHYAMLVISATAGITKITEEHISLLLALDLPFFCVISKCELAPNASVQLTDRLKDLLLPSGKKPLLITDENLARNCVAPQKLIIDTIDIPDDKTGKEETGNQGSETGIQGSETGSAGTGFCEELSPEDTAVKIDDDKSSKPSVPVFPVSCVRGAGLNALHAYLLALQPSLADIQPKHEEETCEFQIDEIFHVGESTGPVVGGLLARGQLYEGDNLIIGPLDSGEFVTISVKTIYRNRVPHGSVRAGQSASLGLGDHPPSLRPGMVLLAIPEHYNSADYAKPTFGGCEPATCKIKTNPSKPENYSKQSKNSNFRRKNKNFIQDIAKVEKSLVKIDHIEDNNLYKSDNEEKKVINKQLSNERSNSIETETKVINKQLINESSKSIETESKVINKQLSDERSKSIETETKVINKQLSNEHSKSIETETKVINKQLSNERSKSIETETKVINKKLSNESLTKIDNIITITNKNDDDENLVNTDSNADSHDETTDFDETVVESHKQVPDVNGNTFNNDKDDDENCKCRDEVLLEDPSDPRGCIFFQASIKVLRHSTAICPGFQCTIHVGNVTQTAIIEGIMSTTHSLRAGQAGSCVFRFARCPEYLVRGRRLLLTAGLGTRAIGRISQIFPYVP